YTHIGEWGKAYDFMITDSYSKTYRNNGFLREDYYCYNKPVFAPADGYVETITNNTDDNEIGKVNTSNNWGNSIVIRHLNGLYTQISHLRKDTFKVKPGDFVKRGEILANCGNSGRSPEPHVHFQVQTVPNVGAKTLDYPFAYYFEHAGDKDQLMQFKKPAQGEKISNVTMNNFLYNAFNILPDNAIVMEYVDGKGIKTTEKWDTYTDAYNQKYIHCPQTNSTAYYINDGFMFYFTAFYGSKTSLLYYFYLSAYKIFLGNNDFIEITDSIPLNMLNKGKLASYLHDFIAPFHQFIKINFTSKVISSDIALGTGVTKLASTVKITGLGKKNIASESTLIITEKGISEFTYQTEDIKIEAVCIN
ncbi:MAG TPA: M23 family metallopeptidase, partial [Paludibacter sp.]|nr:M23 family metallopeptidase [Paludibacter sp.]